MRRCSFSLCFGRQEAQAKFTPHVQHMNTSLRVTCPCLPQAVPALALICTHPCVLPYYEHRLCSSHKSFPEQARTGSQSPMLYTPRPAHPRTALPGGVTILLCRWQPRGPDSWTGLLKPHTESSRRGRGQVCLGLTPAPVYQPWPTVGPRPGGVSGRPDNTLDP